MIAHQEQYYEGNAWANEIAKRGYVVMVSDAFPFESRRVLLADVPEHLRNGLTDLNHDKPELFLGSADLMERNLNRRVELMFPIEDPAIAERIKGEVLDTALRDNVRARRLNPDGTYTRIEPRDGEAFIDSQTAKILARRSETEGIRPVPRMAPSAPVS